MGKLTDEKVSFYTELFEEMCNKLAADMLAELKNRGLDVIVPDDMEGIETGMNATTVDSHQTFLDADGHPLEGMPVVLASKVIQSDGMLRECRKKSAITFKMLIEYEASEEGTLKASKEVLDSVLED